MGGHIVIAGMNLGESHAHGQQDARAGAGQCRAFAAGPDVPSFTEQGVKLVFSSERGIVAPVGLPADVQRRRPGRCVPSPPT
jgi:tripartite-type tricarboxylate transporter receptor subunit TctC